MDRRVFVFSMFALAAKLRATAATPGRKGVFEPDLTKVVQGRDWQVFNRGVSLIDRGDGRAVRFEERADVGLALLKDYQFADGVIEFTLRGKNVLQKRFVGIAFHALDETTCDVIYFRPFNFRNDDPERRGHAVQYVSPPTHSWQQLRKEHPGQYEKPVQPVPDPDDWFRARVVVDSPRVSVFVNDGARPSLVVEKLNERQTGRVGLWVGDDSGGDFASLKIFPK